MLLFALAHAGLIDALDDAQRHLAYCRESAATSEAEHRYKEAVGAWKACGSEAERRGFTTLLPALKAQIAVSQAMADASEYRLENPARFSREVLTVAAEQLSLEYPSDAVREVFRNWMETDEGRAKVSELRTVTLDWREADPKYAGRASEIMRRYIEDMGLKWAEPGSKDVDTILFARLTVQTRSPTVERQGAIQHSDVTIVTERVRFRQLDRDGKGFTASASTDSPDADEAENQALREAAELAARATLQRVLKELFSGE